MNLATTYLGLRLPHPLVIGSGPLTDDLGTVRALVDAGAAALVLRSLYEEDASHEQMDAFFHSEGHGGSSAEAGSYAPDPGAAFGPDEYLEHLRRVKDAAGIPVIASFNGTMAGGWAAHVRSMQDAGADAVELNIYHAASDASTSGAEAERRMVDIVRAVKQGLRIPVAVKLSPAFTAFAHFAMQLDAAGADGIVLFNRSHRVEIDVVELDVVRSREPSTPSDLELRLKGAAIISGRVNASIAVTGGVHSALDVVKATMVGAHATQLVSAVLQHGPRHLLKLRADLEGWMKENEWNSLDEMRGNMGFGRIPDPAAYERENYRKMLR